MGAKAFSHINDLDITGSIIEIGSERNEKSTSYLYSFAKLNGHRFYTIDIDKSQYLNALYITSGHGAYNISGEEFLGNIFPLLNEKIAFAYLDNFDLITHDGRNWDKRRELYKSYGLEMNNTNCKIAHMTQAILVEKYAADTCYILFDDTWVDEKTSEYEGKGAWSIRPLMLCGFHIMNQVFVGNEEEGLNQGFVLMRRTK